MWGAFEYLLGEASVIAEAPVTFAVIVIVLSVITYFVVRHQFKDRFASEESKTEALEARLKLRDDQLADMGQKMESATPGQADELISELKEQIAALQPYGIASEKVLKMVEVLKKAPSDICITQDVSAPDALNLFNQISRVFKEAGWTVDRRQGVLGLTDPPDCGVTLIRNSADYDADLPLIRKALDLAGLDFKELDKTAEPTNLTVPQIAFSSRDPNYVPAARWG